MSATFAGPANRGITSLHLRRTLGAVVLTVVLAAPLGGCSYQSESEPPRPAPEPVSAPEPISAPVSGPAPAASPGFKDIPVYNADITPQHARESSAPNRPVLQAGQVTKMRFGIGPKWKGSVLPDVTPSREILESKHDLPLTVVLVCGFCEPHAESLKRMTYKAIEGRSDEIRFQFTPQRNANGSAYVDKLQLLVMNDATGREYDRLVIDVAVSGSAGTEHRTEESPVVEFDFWRRRDMRSDWNPDLILYATEQMGRNVSISVQPVSEEMKQRLGLALDNTGKRRTFRSGIDDARLVEAMTTSAYGVMNAVNMQGDLLKRLSATGVDAVVSQDSQQSLKLTDAELKSVTNVVADIGQRLYRHLFAETSDTDLGKLIVQLETTAADPKRERPLRLMIVTNKISLPWQYLHPVGPDVDAGKFWGLRFSLSVLRVNTGARAKPIVVPPDVARSIVFAQYGSSADPTVPLAHEQKRQLTRLSKRGLIEVDNGPEFLASLEQQRREISAIFTFLHAKSMASDYEPHLSFNDEDKVTTNVLEHLLNKVPMDEQGSRYLASAPLVFLNACETGPSSNVPHVSLQNVMFQLGAEGVVVTEVSVWISLGHYLATRLIERLGEGEPIGDALTHVRKVLYVEKKNPLGLLYAYYGDPAATLRH